MKRVILLTAVVACIGLLVPLRAVAQEEEAAGGGDAEVAEAAEPTEPAAGTLVATEKEANKNSGGFFHVVRSSGWLGILLWLSIFGSAAAAVYFTVDCIITVRAKRIMPQALIDSVTESMSEGDVLKALQNCEDEPGPLANILSAGFSHVEEGYDVIQEAISTSADLETETIMQKLTWLSVVGNLAPMLGLLGTVQGMIFAFSHLGEGGGMDVAVLATDISQALFTTAAGLTIAVPCVAVYYTFRNAANRIVLHMEAMTIELIKDLRNVEVVEE